MKKEKLFTLRELYILSDEMPFTAIKVGNDRGYHPHYTQLDVRLVDSTFIYYVDCSRCSKKHLTVCDSRAWVMVP
jgi:hypothetical protein